MRRLVETNVGDRFVAFSKSETRFLAGEFKFERGPGGLHERGDGGVLEAGDVLDGEVDDEADDAGEDPDGEAEGPLEHHVPHLVPRGPRPPVLVEQVVLYHPGNREWKITR